MRIKITLLSVLLLLSFKVSAQEKTNPFGQNEELGSISWYRNYNEAVKASEKLNKDILILFQEVPGCATCRNYGQDVLSNPLLTEAIQNEFIPLAIFNNKGGHDGEILNFFNEPSWNNPVVRIVNKNGGDISGRVNADYSALGLFNAMDTALKNKARSIPEYFNLLGYELKKDLGKPLQESFYEMYCFWSGEQHLGNLDGVHETEAGFIGSKEVVRVLFDPDKVTLDRLTEHGKKANNKLISQGDNFNVSKKDLKYNLSHSDFKYIPLSEIQKTKINSCLNDRKAAENLLSPKQLIWLNELKYSKSKNTIYYDSDFKKSWNEKSLSDVN